MDVATILLLEPDAALRSFYESAAEGFGYHALDGYRLELDEVRDVDAVLLEPASAWELAVAHALSERRPGLPIVCASSFTTAARELRVVTFLVKPFTLDQLRRALEAALS